MRKVGIFAGTFDPIHDGHLDVAATAVKHLGLNKVYFLVEAKPWGDKDPVSVGHRKNMVDLAIKDFEQLALLEMLDAQFDIKKTLPQLEQEMHGAELYFIFGGDVFLNMNSKTWPLLDKLLSHYVVVYERGNITEDKISQHAQELGITLAILPSAHLHLASTDVRVEPHKKAVWIPKAVADYIDKNNLYLN